MFGVFKDTLTQLKYFLIFIFTTLVVFALLVWSSNIQLVFSMISYSSADILTRIWIIIEILGSIGTNFSIFSAFSVVTVSILFGLNFSFMLYLIKRFGGVLYDKSVISTGGGMLSAVFGGGCAACGTLVVTPLLSFIGLGGILSILPFGGQEFNILAILFLGFSFWGVLKKIKTAKVIYKV